MKEQVSLDRLTGIVAFARAASLGSFSGAARAMGLSPSAVSKAVGQLERQLGVRLFTRTTRSLVLTPEGADLHERALHLLWSADQLVQSAAAVQSEPSGLLRVAAPLPIGTRLLAPALPAFRRRHPRLKVDLRLDDRFINVVEEGADVAIRIGQLASSGLVSRRFAPIRLGAYASPAYLAERGTPARPEDLSAHDCVNFRYQSSGQLLTWHFDVEGRALDLTPDAAIVVDASDAAIEVVAAGGGVGIAATWIATPYVQRGLLKPVLDAFVAGSSAVTAVWPASRRDNPNVKAFVEFLGELFEAAESASLVGGKAPAAREAAAP